jgi:ribosomal protein S18 acetylase RimI-like enzyme
MDLRIVPESVNDLAAYSTIPIAFPVRSRLAVKPVADGLGGLLLVEEPVTPPYVKDYDALPGEGPAAWSGQFDLSRWGLLGSFDGTLRVGGAAVAWKTPALEMLDGRDDLAVLWDMRVHPDYRGRGVGQRLFAAAADWARQRGCRELRVETQNNNVTACRFYARQGCELRTIRRDAYPSLPDEVQLLWRYVL